MKLGRQAECTKKGSRKALELLKKRVTGSDLHLRMTNVAAV